MPEMTPDEMIGGLLHDIARAQCHLEDADRDLSVVAAELAKLMKALEPSTA
jgi:HD superfamily phosphodiesterase